MTTNVGTLVVAPVRPYDSEDEYPTHEDQYGKGGYRVVADITARDAITDDRRSVGMRVHVISTARDYRLVGGTANANWVEVGTDGDDTLREDLASEVADKGASLVGLEQGGTVQDVIQKVSLLAFRHLVNGGDWTAAINAWIAYGVVNNLRGYAPAGTYRTTGNHNCDNFAFDGDGIGLTVFNITGSTGAYGFILTRDSREGCGPNNCTVKESGTGNSGILLGTVRHARMQNVEVSDFVGAEAHAKTAQAGGASTITLAADASSTDDAYLGMLVYIDSGTGAGQSGLITGYVGATKVATISVPWDTQPDSTSVYTVIRGGNGFHWRNEDGSWTESNLVVGMRSSNCLVAYRFGQKPGDPGTSSFGYNKILGSTVSLMPPRGKGLFIETDSMTSSLYGAVVELNIYMDSSITSKGVHIDGRLNQSNVRIAGERPGGGSQEWFRLSSTGQMRETVGSIVGLNGSVSISPSAALVNNECLIASNGANVWRPMHSTVSVSSRLNGSANISSGAWTALTSWTDDLERPSGANNWASGVFTAPQRGNYRVSCSACFTPTAGDICAVRIVTTSRNYVIAQDVAETSDDFVVGGSHVVSLSAGDTLSMEVKTSNGGGDTIRASDADGSKTLFGIEYLSQ